MTTTPSSDEPDFRRYANRIRDAYTLTEAESLLRELFTAHYESERAELVHATAQRSHGSSSAEDSRELRIPIPVKIDFSRKNFNPAEDIQEFEVTTVGRYRAKREREASLAWYEKHKPADVLVVNQDGDPLYALYKSPLASHEEITTAMFKELRRQRYFDEEIDVLEGGSANED